MQSYSNNLSTRSKDSALQTALVPVLLRPDPPCTTSSPLSLVSSIASSSSNSQPQGPALWSPNSQATSVYEACPQADTSQFPIDVPSPAICDQTLATQMVNLAFFQTTNTFHGPFVTDSSEKSEYASICFSPPDVKQFLSGTSSNPPVTVSPSLAQNTGAMPFSGFLDDPLCNQQFSLAYNTMPFSPAQIETLQNPDLEFSLDPFLNLDMITPTHSLEARADDEFFSDILHQSSVPSNEETEKAKKMAHLEMLKQQKDLIQERIHFLYVTNVLFDADISTSH